MFTNLIRKKLKNKILFHINHFIFWCLKLRLNRRIRVKPNAFSTNICFYFLEEKVVEERMETLVERMHPFTTSTASSTTPSSNSSNPSINFTSTLVYKTQNSNLILPINLPWKKRVRRPEKEEIFGSLWRIMMIKEVGCRDAPSKKMKTMKRHRRTIIPARSTLILKIFDQSLIWQEFQN